MSKYLLNSHISHIIAMIYLRYISLTYLFCFAHFNLLLIFPSSTHFSWPKLDNTEGPRSPEVCFFNHTGCTEFLYWMKLAGFYWLRIIHSILRKFTPKFLLTKLHEWFSLTSKVRAMMLTWTFVNNRIYKDILYLCHDSGVESFQMEHELILFSFWD